MVIDISLCQLKFRMLTDGYFRMDTEYVWILEMV